MRLLNSGFVGFVFLSTSFDGLRIYKAELEHMNGFLKMICHFRYEQRSEENVRNASYIIYDAVVPLSGCFFNFKSSIHDRASRGIEQN